MKSRPTSLRAVAVLLLAMPVACDDDDDGGNADPAVTQACEDTADAVAEAAQRCGQDYDVNREGFIDVAAEGDCRNIDSVRDIRELYDVCFPSLAAIECAELLAGNLDESCRAQLERRVGLVCEQVSAFAACVDPTVQSR